MYRSLSTGNRTCHQKVLDRNYSMHQERLKNIRSVSSKTMKLQNQDSEIIKTASYLRNHDKKKEVQNEEYYTKVERENKILLVKMADIVHSKMKSTLNNFNSSTHSGLFKTKSLNQFVRKKEIVRITSDNYGILNRIQQQASTYDIDKWEKDFKDRGTYLKNICLFPVITQLMHPQTKSPRRSNTSGLAPSPRGSTSMKHHQNLSTVNPPKISLSGRKMRTLSVSRRVSSGSLPNITSERLSESCRESIVFQKETQISSKSCKIEFIKLTDGRLKIAINNVTDSLLKIIILDEDKAKQLMIEDNNDYDKIISKIDLKNDRVQIKDLDFECETKSNLKIELFDPIASEDKVKQSTGDHQITRRNE